MEHQLGNIESWNPKRKKKLPEVTSLGYCIHLELNVSSGLYCCLLGNRLETCGSEMSCYNIDKEEDRIKKKDW